MSLSPFRPATRAETIISTRRHLGTDENGAGLFISFMLAAPTTGSDPVHYSRYESVEIQASDTLWKIIEENTPAQEDGHTYLKHVVFLNGIQTDQKLHAGAYLLLPRV